MAADMNLVGCEEGIGRIADKRKIMKSFLTNSNNR
jgi:hypothetical protein